MAATMTGTGAATATMVTARKVLLGPAMMG